MLQRLQSGAALQEMHRFRLQPLMCETYGVRCMFCEFCGNLGGLRRDAHKIRQALVERLAGESGRLEGHLNRGVLQDGLQLASSLRVSLDKVFLNDVGPSLAKRRGGMRPPWPF